MSDFLAPYLILLAVPVGWLYAYVAHIGYRKDITRYDPERTKTAVGGALITAYVIFTSQHAMLGDTVQWGTALADWAFYSTGKIASGMSDNLADQMNYAFIRLVRLSWAFIATFVLSALIGAALLAGALALLFGRAGGTALIGLSIVAVYSAAAAAIVALPGFLMGIPIILYFLFVRLPLQLIYRRAIREGRRPTTKRLVWALQNGALGKRGWQADIMAYRGHKFGSELNAATNKIDDVFN